jgi:ubiquinone/menaquinone biosynthesis C-methylase UbiE
MPDAEWWAALWPDAAKVLTDVGVRLGMDVVDLCCGDGWFTAPLSKIARRVVAIDIDAALLEVAKRRVAEHGGARNCTFVEADAYDIANVVKQPVDHVLLANVFHGVPDKPRLARAVREVLKPGGLFAIVNWHARPREQTTVLGQPRGPATELRMTPEQTIAGVEPGGLKFRNRAEVSPYHYGAVFERPR